MPDFETTHATFCFFPGGPGSVALRELEWNMRTVNHDACCRHVSFSFDSSHPRNVGPPSKPSCSWTQGGAQNQFVWPCQHRPGVLPLCHPPQPCGVRFSELYRGGQGPVVSVESSCKAVVVALVRNVGTLKCRFLVWTPKRDFSTPPHKAGFRERLQMRFCYWCWE